MLAGGQRSRAMNTHIYTTVYLVIYVVSVPAALLFVARLLGGLFSQKIVNQMKRHPRLHFLWGCVASLGVLMCLSLPGLPPPRWLVLAERHHLFLAENRKWVLEQVQPAGSWPAVRQGCEWLLTNKPDFSEWRRPWSNVWVYPELQTHPNRHYMTNLDLGPLPPALAALKPMEIDRVQTRQDENRLGFSVLRITIWPGGTDRRYYGLAVVCGTNAQSYSPPKASPGYRSLTYRKIAEGVYEVFD
jgi:hypothetical protein